MARPGRRQTGARRSPSSQQRRAAHPEDVMSMLARAVREVEAAVERRRVTPAVRTKFQVVALLVREEHARVQDEQAVGQARRAEQLKRLDGIATILAKTAVRDPTLLALLAEDAVVSDAASSLKREMLRAVGIEARAGGGRAGDAGRCAAAAPSAGSCRSRSSRASWPTRSSPRTSPPPGRGRPARAGWPAGSCSTRCFSSFERADERRPGVHGAARRRTRCGVPGDRELMPHQAQLVAAAAAGHRTFLLADEPGLGKTAQALLAAEAANAYPLLVVVPSVVKTNWAREAGLWTPNRKATVGARQRRHRRRLRRHRRRQLRGARPARRLVRRVRLPRHGRRRGALHQEQDLAALAARAGPVRAHPVAHRRGRC